MIHTDTYCCLSSIHLPYFFIIPSLWLNQDIICWSSRRTRNFGIIFFLHKIYQYIKAVSWSLINKVQFLQRLKINKQWYHWRKLQSSQSLYIDRVRNHWKSSRAVASKFNTFSPVLDGAEVYFIVCIPLIGKWHGSHFKKNWFEGKRLLTVNLKGNTKSSTIHFFV